MWKAKREFLKIKSETLKPNGRNIEIFQHVSFSVFHHLSLVRYGSRINW
jgi:hypothetical protein